MFSKLTEAQKQFFETGRTRDLAFRICQLQLLADAMRKNETVLGEALKKDLGKSAFESYATEIGFVLADIRYTIQNLQKWSAPKRVRTPLYLFPGKSKIQKEPYGSVLILGPYNYPVQLLAEPLVGAIAAGNCAVLKPSELTPHVSEAMYQIVHSTFKEEYIACVEGGVEVNQELLSQKFDYIFFTGSERVGRIVMKAAAENLTPVTLELGGKSPCIVEESANIKLAAKRIVFGKFLNSGQTCVAPDYIFVDKKAESELIFYLKYWINKMIGEHPLSNKDYSSMINPRHYQRIMELMKHEKIVEGGYGDIRLRKIAPTILVNVKEESTVMQEEIFGPLLPIMTYGKLEDAVSYIRDHNKPLALYLFTENDKVEQDVLSQLSFGGGCINDTIIHLATPYLGFGGVGNSGMGSYHGKKSFDTFTHEKSIIKKSDKIDIPVRYMPYNKAKEQLMKFFLKL